MTDLFKGRDFNDPEMDEENVLHYLKEGKRIPQNDYEISLMKEFNLLQQQDIEIEVSLNSL